MGCLSGDAERLESLHSRTCGNGVWNVDQGLGSLADRHGGDHRVGQRVDRDHLVVVLQPDIDPRAIPRWPNPMGQLAYLDRGNLAEIIGTEDLNFVQAAHRT